MHVIHYLFFKLFYRSRFDIDEVINFNLQIYIIKITHSLQPDCHNIACGTWYCKHEHKHQYMYEWKIYIFYYPDHLSDNDFIMATYGLLQQ